jgi:CheY-like chemotaxis protein
MKTVADIEFIARAIDPDAWQNYDESNGNTATVTRPLSSLAAAQRVLTAVHETGGRIAGASRLSSDNAPCSVSTPDEKETGTVWEIVRNHPPERRVLLVEDRPAVSDLISAFLQSVPNVALEVEIKGSDAIDAAGRYRYDALLISTQLQDMEGSDMIASLRRLPLPFCSTPIVALIGDANPAYRLAILALGAQEVLASPVRPDELVRVLDQSFPSLPVNDDRIDGHTLSAMLRDLGQEHVPLFIARFVSETRGKLATMRSIRDHDTMQAEAHTLKGTSRSFGAFQVSLQASQLEHACRTGAPWTTINALLDAAEQSLTDAEAAYANYQLL